MTPPHWQCKLVASYILNRTGIWKLPYFACRKNPELIPAGRGCTPWFSDGGVDGGFLFLGLKDRTWEKTNMSLAKIEWDSEGQSLPVGLPVRYALGMPAKDMFLSSGDKTYIHTRRSPQRWGAWIYCKYIELGYFIYAQIYFYIDLVVSYVGSPRNSYFVIIFINFFCSIRKIVMLFNYKVVNLKDF